MGALVPGLHPGSEAVAAFHRTASSLASTPLAHPHTHTQEMFLGQLAAMLERRRLTAPAAGLVPALATPASADSSAAVRRGGWPINITRLEAMNAARRVLGYDLTAAQERVLSDILSDLAGPQTMMRLLQGDVGCGKTAVALLAMMAACGSGACAHHVLLASCPWS